MTAMNKLIDQKLTRSEFLDLLTEEARALLTAERDAIPEVPRPKATLPTLAMILPPTTEVDWSVGDDGHGSVYFRSELKPSQVPQEWKDWNKAWTKRQEAITRIEAERAKLDTKEFRIAALKGLLSRSPEGRDLLKLIGQMQSPVRKALTGKK